MSESQQDWIGENLNGHYRRRILVLLLALSVLGGGFYLSWPAVLDIVVEPSEAEIQTPQAVHLSVSTEPAGAQVWIQELDQAYRDGMTLPVGHYTLEGSADGYLPEIATVELVAGREPPPVSFSLKRRPLRTGDTHRDRLSDGSEGPMLVFVEGSTFMMGSAASEAGRFEERERQHRVEDMSDFYIGKYPVTVGEFRRFEQATNYRTEAERHMGKSGCWAVEGGTWSWRAGRNWHSPGFSQDDGHPVICVSWNDAVAYVEWLSDETGQDYNLLTEIKWEYAARAGTRKARYWGDDPDTDQACRYANVADQSAKVPSDWTIHDCDDRYSYTAPVGEFEPNDWGLYDMLGNVWEWTCSVYEVNYGGAEKSCAAAGASGPRAIRGGSWLDGPRGVRAALRYGLAPGNRNDLLGLRVSRSP